MGSVLRTVLAVSSLGAAVAVGAASPASASVPGVVTDGLSRADTSLGTAAPAVGLGTAPVHMAATPVEHGVDSNASSVLEAVGNPVTHLSTNPLSHGGFNPLSNTVGAQVADFQPVDTGLATGPVSHGDSLAQILGG